MDNTSKTEILPSYCNIFLTFTANYVKHMPPMAKPKTLKLLLTLLLLCFCSMIAHAREDSIPKLKKHKKCHRRVGYFASLKPERLARKLTKNLNSDSEKVAAIHCWITSHIRYDIKKFKNNDYVVKSNRYILRHRKAICYGYATLFKELCTHVGVQSVIVTGYTKNSDIDICDSFYLEDHAWNAVFINQRWYLSDLTWDAGYIMHWKRNLIDKIVFVATLGRHDHIRNRIHFKRSPRWEYYMKPGDYFRYDHMPANPIWQLTEDVWTINGFKTDSSYYYLRERDSSDTYSNEFEAERQEYFNNTDSLNEITDGFAFNAYNFRNHYQVSISDNYLSKPFDDELDFKSKDSVYQLRQADSVIAYCNKSILHSDSNKYYLEEQLQMQLEHIALKNHTLKSQNNQLMRTSGKTINHAKKGLRIKGRIEKSIRRNKPLNNKNVRKILADKKFREARPANAVKTEDSLRLENRILQLDSQISVIQSGHDSMMGQADMLLLSLFPRLQTCIAFQKEKRHEAIRSIRLRKFRGFDDLDYPIRKLKDSLMVHDQLHDSDLFSGNRLIYDSLYKICQQVQNQYKLIIRTHKLKLGAIRQLKTKCPQRSSPEILRRYNEEIKGIVETLSEYEIWQDDFCDLLDSSQAGNLEIRVKAKQTIRVLKFEKKFRIMTSRFRKNTKSLKTLNKIRKQYTSKQLRKAKKVKKKFTRVKKA
jgi:hypothetical protein